MSFMHLWISINICSHKCCKAEAHADLVPWSRLEGEIWCFTEGNWFLEKLLNISVSGHLTVKKTTTKACVIIEQKAFSILLLCSEFSRVGKFHKSVPVWIFVKLRLSYFIKLLKGIIFCVLAAHTMPIHAMSGYPVASSCLLVLRKVMGFCSSPCLF